MGLFAGLPLVLAVGSLMLLFKAWYANILNEVKVFSNNYVD